MLSLIIPGLEGFDESKNEFVKAIPDQEIQLEHSLLSLSKWEMKWHKPLLHTIETKKITTEQILDYISCMTLTKNVDPNAYLRLSTEHFSAIEKYIDDPMTATTFSRRPNGRREILTNEVIYYSMFKYGIPIECEKWHLNRLFTLIRVAVIKGGPEEKMPFSEMARAKREANEARKRRK